MSKPIIINTIPMFIEKLAESLCEEPQISSAVDDNNFAFEHGSERARVTRYGPEQVLEEYKLLRNLIRKELAKVSPLTERDEEIIARSFDGSIQQSMVAYFLVHSKIREQFVAALTHDLRNPIGAIKLAADLARETLDEELKPESIAELKDFHSRIIKSVKRADRMIQDMLDATIVQVGEVLSLKITECQLQTIVQEAIGQRSSKEGALLKVKVENVIGYWDPDAFQRSIENLLSNAFKYGDGGNVSLVAKESHERVLVSVHNFGNPIPAEIRESLFQAFRRSESAKGGSTKGWGIGLALARTVSEQMGGSLGCESSAEKGTTFTIDVPKDARPFLGAPITN